MGSVDLSYVSRPPAVGGIVSGGDTIGALGGACRITLSSIDYTWRAKASAGSLSAQ